MIIEWVIRDVYPSSVFFLPEVSKFLEERILQGRITGIRIFQYSCNVVEAPKLMKFTKENGLLSLRRPPPRNLSVVHWDPTGARESTSMVHQINIQ